MNNLRKKIDALTTNAKLALMSGGFSVLIVIIGLIGISLATPDSTILKDQVVEGLSFENADLDYSNGVSTFTVEVTNLNEVEYSLKYITISFKDSNNNTSELIGYIGNSLDTDETREIKASIDKDITDSTSITYSIVKN